jgi:predicted NUDIX family NTP pyrophosphohydrolase
MKTSAGLLLYRGTVSSLELLLAHPGGPYFRNKDQGAWSIPKGEVADGEDPRACALRELREETGIALDAQASLLPLGEIKQRGGKRVLAWAVPAADTLELLDPPPSNTFELEWPPRSGKRQSFPEIDQLAFFPLAVARQKLLAAQVELVDRLLVALVAPAAQADK